ncbi:hypothetical protein BKA82DRAFT_4140677 [Pisolithus tinctorius]|nr:hypothetical protein BKA82DRAFT_4140677 [Pisolithus tinctorius]
MHISGRVVVFDRHAARFNKLLCEVVISQGGLVPFINPELLPRKTSKGKESQEL